MTKIRRVDPRHAKTNIKTKKSNDSLIKIARDLEKVQNNSRKVDTFKQRVNNLTVEQRNDSRIGRLISEAGKEQHGNFFQWLSMIAQGNQLPTEETLNGNYSALKS